MAKTIVFCADGTWNGPGQSASDDGLVQTTNVYKLFANLAGEITEETAALPKEQEKVLHDGARSVVQWAKYLHGVGNSDNFLVRLLGGTLGAGLIARIVRGYTFISRNYVTGDRIALVGFSRGAYTARALAGLINAKGLLDPTRSDLTDKTNAYRLGLAAWFAYRRAAVTSDLDLLGRVTAVISDVAGLLSGDVQDELFIKANIDTVAVWDTVGALGIPDFNLKTGRVDDFQFADRVLSANVSRGFHAISVDERRSDFTPTLWESDTRVEQVLFPGSHADVGGGNPLSNLESGLSDCALAWMMEKLVPLVTFAQPGSHVPAPSPTATAHQPWLDAPWNLLVRSTRTFPSGLSLSKCLIARRQGGLVQSTPKAQPGPYNPENLVSYFDGTNPAAGVLVV